MKPLKSIKSYINREKNFNKKLVKTLNHKIFKGYRISQESKKVLERKTKYFDDIFWESKTVDPFDDYYSIEYKKKNLSSLYKKDFSNLLQINNISKKLEDESGLIKRLNANIQKGESFRNKKLINLRKQDINNERYFYFCSNSQLNKKNSSESKEKSEQLYNTIFQDSNEKGLYNDIPIFAIEKIYKVNNNRNKKRIKYIKEKEERINDLQFLYKISHERPKKKIDFRNKYNIQSSKSAIMSNGLINKMSKNLKAYSTKSIQKFKLNDINKSNRKSRDISNFTIFNSSINIRNISKELKKNLNNFSQIARKKTVNEIGTQSKDSQFRYTPSLGSIFFNQSNLFKEKKEIKNKRKSYSCIYPIKDRIISDKILKDQFDFKKWKLNKLKNLMEI